MRCGAPPALAHTGGEIGVDDFPDGTIADRVGRHLEPGLGVSPHGAGVSGRILPERLKARPCGIRLVEPGGSGLDHAVGVELDHAAAPPVAAAVAHGEVGGRALLVETGFVVDGRHDADRQSWSLLQGVEQVERGEAAVHDRAAGEAGVAQATQQFVSDGEGLIAGQRRGAQPHGLVGAELVQLPGGAAIGIDDHARRVLERARAGDARTRESRTTGEGGVPVEHDQQRRESAHRVFDRRRRHRQLVEHVVVEVPAAHPRVGVLGERAIGFGSKRREESGAGGQAAEVDPRRQLDALNGMQVRIDESGGHRCAAEIVDDGAGSAQFTHQVVVADGEEAAVAHGEGCGVRAARVHRHHVRAGDNGVGVETGHGLYLRRGESFGIERVSIKYQTPEQNRAR